MADTPAKPPTIFETGKRLLDDIEVMGKDKDVVLIMQKEHATGKIRFGGAVRVNDRWSLGGDVVLSHDHRLDTFTVGGAIKLGE